MRCTIVHVYHPEYTCIYTCYNTCIKYYIMCNSCGHNNAIACMFGQILLLVHVHVYNYRKETNQ